MPQLIGLCDVNVLGLLDLYYNHSISSPAIRRHVKEIENNEPSQMEFGNANQLSEAAGIPINKIVNIPS